MHSEDQLTSTIMWAPFVSLHFYKYNVMDFSTFQMENSILYLGVKSYLERLTKCY